MSDLHPAPPELTSGRVDRLLLAIDVADQTTALRRAGFEPEEIARLITMGRELKIGPMDAAREIVRCSLAVVDGEFA